VWRDFFVDVSQHIAAQRGGITTSDLPRRHTTDILDQYSG